MKYLFIIFFLFLFAFGCSKNSLTEKKIIFIGDSHVFKWNLDTYFPEFVTRNMGVSGLRIGDILKDTSLLNPSDISVILIGSNDAIDYASSGKSTDKLLLDYISMISAFRRHAQVIILIGIPPVGPSYLTSYPLLPSIHKAVEQKFISLLYNTPGIYYLSTYSCLSGNGKLIADYTQDDLHLNNFGYYTLSGQLRSIIYEILN